MSKLKEKLAGYAMAAVIVVGIFLIVNIFFGPPGRKTPKATVTTFVKGFENANYSSIAECYVPSIRKPLEEFFDDRTSSQQSSLILLSNPQIAEPVGLHHMLIPVYLSRSKLSVLEYQEAIEGNSAYAEVALGVDGDFSGVYLIFQLEKVGEEWLINRSYSEE